MPEHTETEMRGHPADRIVEIEIERLRPFKDHPFSVKDDQDMEELIKSISMFGIMDPILARTTSEGNYEIISGHRRHYAAEKLGFRRVPVRLQALNDVEAVVAMVDSNMHRSHILPSEKATAYRMKYDALLLRKQNANAYGPKQSGRIVEIMGEEAKESPKQIQRYIRIATLSRPLLDLLDSGRISFNPAYELSFLSSEEQDAMAQAIDYTQCSPSISQCQRLKELSAERVLTFEDFKGILYEVKKSDYHAITFKRRVLIQYLPDSMSAEEMQDKVLEILKEWKERKQLSDEKEKANV